MLQCWSLVENTSPASTLWVIVVLIIPQLFNHCSWKKIVIICVKFWLREVRTQKHSRCKPTTLQMGHPRCWVHLSFLDLSLVTETQQGYLRISWISLVNNWCPGFSVCSPCSVIVTWWQWSEPFPNSCYLNTNSIEHLRAKLWYVLGCYSQQGSVLLPTLGIYEPRSKINMFPSSYQHPDCVELS